MDHFCTAALDNSFESPNGKHVSFLSSCREMLCICEGQGMFCLHISLFVLRASHEAAWRREITMNRPTYLWLPETAELNKALKFLEGLLVTRCIMLSSYLLKGGSNWYPTSRSSFVLVLGYFWSCPGLFYYLFMCTNAISCMLIWFTLKPRSRQEVDNCQRQ